MVDRIKRAIQSIRANGYPRIRAKVSPGAGDKGECNLNYKNIKKASPLNDFYSCSEDVQLANNKCLIYGNFFDPCGYIKTFLNFSKNSIPSLNSFYYSLTQNFNPTTIEKYSFKNEHYLAIDKKVKELQPIYGGSKEFRIFCTNSNLHLLDALRVNYRRLELCYHKSLSYLEDQGRLDSLDNISDKLLLTSKILNRSSSLLWNLILKEEADLKEEPEFWIGEMPNISFDGNIVDTIKV